MYQVVYHLRTQPLVSVVVPNKDAPEMLQRCLDSLSKGSYANYEVIVVENGSTRPETFAFYREATKQPHVRVVEWGKPFNYAAVNNFAALQAAGDFLLFLNNDVESISPDWLEVPRQGRGATRCRGGGGEALLRGRHGPARRHRGRPGRAWRGTRT